MANPAENAEWEQISKSVDDVFERDPISKGMAWLDSVDLGGDFSERSGKFARRLLREEIMWDGVGLPRFIKARDDAAELCKVWDTDPTTDRVNPISKIAFMATRVLNISSRIQQSRYDDFSSGIETLRQQGREHAEIFAHMALMRMEFLDPDTAALYRMLDNKLNEVYEELPDADKHFQKAGIALAYVMGKKTSHPELMEHWLN